MTCLDPFDPHSLSLEGTPLAVPSCTATPTRPPRHAPGCRFLKGPIPWVWLDYAARLPGKSLALGLVLWQEAGYRRHRTVKLCLRRAGLGISEQAARRALRCLEIARLVSVKQQPGRGLEVTLEDLSDNGA
jgi:hypothetical protein